MIGSEIAKALERHKHEVIRASLGGDVKVSLQDTAGNVDAVNSCTGNAAFKPFAG
jgi:hypothetical protein